MGHIFMELSKGAMLEEWADYLGVEPDELRGKSEAQVRDYLLAKIRGDHRRPYGNAEIRVEVRTIQHRIPAHCQFFAALAGPGVYADTRGMKAGRKRPRRWVIWFQLRAWHMGKWLLKKSGAEVY